MFIILALLIASFTFYNFNNKIKEEFFNFKRHIKPHLVKLNKRYEKNGTCSVSETESPNSYYEINKNMSEISNNAMKKYSNGKYILQPTYDEIMENELRYIDKGMVNSPGPGMVNSPGPGMVNSPGPGMVNSPGHGIVNSPGPGMVNSPGHGIVNSPGPGMVNSSGHGMVNSPNNKLNYVNIVQENFDHKKNPTIKYYSQPEMTENYVNIVKENFDNIPDDVTDVIPNVSSAKIQRNDINPFNYNEDNTSKQKCDLSKFISNTSSTLPISTMENISEIENDEEEEEGVEKEMYNAVRYVFSNSNSRTKSQGCPFRGDLYIAPVQQISKSHYGVSDLQQGALSTMGGFNNNNDSIVNHARYNSLIGSNHHGGEILTNDDLKNIGAFTDIKLLN